MAHLDVWPNRQLGGLRLLNDRQHSCQLQPGGDGVAVRQATSCRKCLVWPRRYGLATPQAHQPCIRIQQSLCLCRSAQWPG